MKVQIVFTNNEFSLSSSNRHKGVNTLNTSLHWFVDGLSRNNTWSLNFNSSSGGGLKRAKSINGVTRQKNEKKLISSFFFKH